MSVVFSIKTRLKWNGNSSLCKHSGPKSRSGLVALRSHGGLHGVINSYI